MDMIILGGFARGLLGGVLALPALIALRQSGLDLVRQSLFNPPGYHTEHLFSAGCKATPLCH